MKRKVLASCFSDKKGNHENNLFDGGYYYSELSIAPKKKDFKALGDLKNGHKLRITYNGKSIVATKADVGAGGPSKPQIDIHWTAAKALGISNPDNFLAAVEIEDIQ